MRIGYAFAVLLLWGAAAPALADVTLRYAAPGGRGQPLVIQADDAGRIRVEGANGQTILFLDGETYMTAGDGEAAMTGRMDDVLSVTGEQLRGFLRAEAMPSGHRLTDQGAETVGQWRGRRYAIEPVGGDTNGPPSRGVELVVSDDPALAPLREATRRAFAAMTRLLSLSFVHEPPGLLGHVDEVLARGAVLRFSRQFVLESIETDPVPPERFALPGPLLDRDALRARLGPPREGD